MHMVRAACSSDDLESHLDRQVREFCAFAGRSDDVPLLACEIAASVLAMCATLRRCERAGIPDARLAAIVSPAVELKLASPFFSRIRTWPRGYAGDFETIEYLVRGETSARDGGFAEALDRFLLASGMADQHRFKVQAQADEIVAVCARGRQPRILVLGCGGGLDLLRARHVIARSRARRVLNDLDPEALALCRARVAAAGVEPVLTTENCFVRPSGVAALGPFDLVVAGGVFDYVPTRLLRRFLRTASDRLLAPGGRIFATNIVDGHPYLSWMRHFGNWRLIERTHDDLRLLAHGLPLSVRVSLDPTGLAWLARFDSAIVPPCADSDEPAVPGLVLEAWQ
jgi:SAM-dependent methyltransferase